MDTGGPVCDHEEKPVIRMYSTEWCPYCEWVGSAYDRVAKQYIDEGKIIAYHWKYGNDGWDNTLTQEREEEIPITELDIFDEFNPENSVPLFVFGCKYYRIGNRNDQDLLAEEKEFRAVIDALL
jgi:thiol-disulfide isomerase/thioredoxin